MAHEKKKVIAKINATVYEDVNCTQCVEVSLVGLSAILCNIIYTMGKEEWTPSALEIYSSIGAAIMQQLKQDGQDPIAEMLDGIIGKMGLEDEALQN